jgi:hypothetical protein
MERRFAQMTDATPALSVLVRLPRRLRDSYESPMPDSKDRTLGKVLGDLTAWSGQPHKWRRDVLLIGVRNAVSGANGEDAGAPDARLSWSLVKKLRADAAANSGFLTTETLCWAAANLSRSEQKRLALEEFPAIERTEGAFFLSPENSLFAYLGRQRPGYLEQIRSARGLSIQRLPENMADTLQLSAKSFSATEPLQSIRLEEGMLEQQPAYIGKEPPERWLRLFFLGRDGKPLSPWAKMEMRYPGRLIAPK